MMDTWNPAQLNEKINMGGSGSGSGSELPDITPADYGSYLAVDENGEWGLDRPKTMPDYSTDETATGQKWIDGKELYQKILVYDMSDNTIAQGTSTVISTGVSDADFIYVDKFWFVDPTTNGIYTSPQVDTYNTFPEVVYDDRTKIRFRSSTSWNSYTGRIVYILIKYTKQSTETKKKTKK